MYFLSNSTEDLGFVGFEEEIFRRANIGDTTSYLYIVPTGAAARELINTVTELSAGRAISVPHILSLDDFIGSIAKSILPHLRVLSDAESAVFIELVIKDLLRQNELEYFEGESQAGPKLPMRRGTFELLVASIGGLKESGISPQRLRNDAAAAGSDKERKIADRSALRRARDLAAIYAAYNQRLGSAFTDRSGQSAIVADHFGLTFESLTEAQRIAIRNVIVTLFGGIKDIFVGSFIRIHEPAQKILFALSQMSGLRLTFGVDFDPKNRSLFELQDRFVQKATDFGLAFIIPKRQTESLPAPISSFHEQLRSNLFLQNSADAQTDVDVFSYKAATMKDELRFAAKRIKKIVSDPDNPVELSRICVASYRQDDYAPLAREIFREYGIPANITDRARLDRSPLYLAFNALFDLAEFNFNRRSLLRLLSSPYLFIADANGEQVDAANLYTVISQYRLRHGSKSWFAEIDALLEDMNEEMQSGLDNYEREDIEKKRRELQKAKYDIGIVEALVQRFKGAKTPSEFQQTVLGVIKEAKVLPQMLSSSAAMLEADALEFDTRSYRALLTLLEELVDLCSQLGLETTALPLSFYTERIRIASLRTRFAPRAEPGRGVIVTSFEQTIGYEFDHLFLVGLNDGMFPESYAPSVFNLKEHQPSEDDTLFEQRFLFYQTLCTFRSKAYLLWHEGSDDRKSEIMHSQFVDALAECVPIIPISDDPKIHDVFSPNEFFRYAGSSGATVEEILPVAKASGLHSVSIGTFSNQITHAVRVGRFRSETPFSEYSGVLEGGALTSAQREKLKQYRNSIYSISQLETYAACPFKYYAKYVLFLEAGLRTDTEDGLSSSERGTILHETLFRILSGIRERNKDIRSMNDEEFQSISAEILSTDARSALPEKNHPFWRLDKESVFEPPAPSTGMLQKFIDTERRYADFITKPSFFEANFGIDSNVAHRDSELYSRDHVEIGGIKLRGKIDRIDLDRDTGIFSVTDYKSGKNASHNDILSGMSLQLPLYLRIAEDLLRTHFGDESMMGVAGIYHTLLGKESKQQLAIGVYEFAGKAFEGHKRVAKLKSEVESVEELQSIIEATIAFAKSYVEGITQGLFPLVREENKATVCTHCNYKLVCRVGEAMESGALRP